MRCSTLIFNHPEQTADLSATLKDILGAVSYHYLIIFLGYIKLCHQWLTVNPQVSHQQDRRSQLHLGSMLLAESKLAPFFKAEVAAKVPAVAESHLVEQGNNLAETQPHPSESVKTLPQVKQEALSCLANAPFPVMIHHSSGEIVYLNQSWLQTTGYSSEEIPTVSQWRTKAKVEQREIVRLPDSKTSTLQQKYIAFAHQTAIETTSELQQIINSLLGLDSDPAHPKKAKIADAVRSEVTISTSTGERLFWELYSGALNSERNEANLTIYIAKDITEIVDRDRELAAVKAKLRLVLDATKTGSWSWDLTNNIVELCHRGRTLLGLTEFNGSYASFLGAIEPQERESIDLEIARVIQSHQDLDLSYSVTKGDRSAQIRITGKLSYNEGKPISLAGIVRDLTNPPDIATEGVATPTSSMWSSNQLATIINLLPYHLFVIDLATETISTTNYALIKSLARSESELIGKKIAECFSPEYAAQIDWQHQQAITYKQVLHVQEEVVLADGTHYWDTVVTPLFDTDGEIYALLRTSSDIPDLAATQEALSQRTLQLEAANKELESFSYSVSHDLQAPLRIINGFSEVLWSNYQLHLDDRGRHYLQRIQANSKRMSDLIDALLQLSRVTRSQMKSVRINLSEIAVDIIAELQVDSPERQVEASIAPDLTAEGDPQLLRIVLSNLLHNAWKYTSKRSLARIEFGAIAENVPQATYYVRDNGAGFDPEYVAKLFTAFQRLHSESEFPGTGIGLATVQRIIYRHGGKVWAEGECDRGATIYFSL